ncbi:MAG TPA: arginine--tRNA ligase, partial [Deltaproteobacteria bacterium]|nr:arginine--tRNA ligase [Deltaproteobacteria bacterium]
MKEAIEHLLREAIGDLVRSGAIPPVDTDRVSLEVPPEKTFGDFSTNIALVSAKKAKMPPQKLASTIASTLARHDDVFERVEVAGPGFINLHVAPGVWIKELRRIVELKASYGRSNAGRGRKVQVEFVSANPTGPLHVGHGRGAAVGDTLARILDAAGFDVQTEYYVNDVGNQMNNLGASVLHRYRELHGVESAFPENGYKGDYIREIAAELKAERADSLMGMPEDEALRVCRDFAAASIMNGIRKDLELFNVRFDRWFNESSLYEAGKVALFAIDEAHC